MFDSNPEPPINPQNPSKTPPQDPPDGPLGWPPTRGLINHKKQKRIKTSHAKMQLCYVFWVAPCGGWRVRRCDLGIPFGLEHGHCGPAELEVQVQDLPATIPKGPDDVMLVVKANEADRAPSQILCVGPACFKSRLIHAQPWGVQPRRAKSKKLVDSINHVVPKLLAQKLIL